MSLNKLKRILDTQLMVSLFFMLILPIRTTLCIHITPLSLVCPLFCVIIVTFLIMVLVTVHIVIMLILPVQMWKKR